MSTHRAHNPKIVGSNPTPATTEVQGPYGDDPQGPFSFSGGPAWLGITGGPAATISEKVPRLRAVGAPVFPRRFPAPPPSLFRQQAGEQLFEPAFQDRRIGFGQPRQGDDPAHELEAGHEGEEGRRPLVGVASGHDVPQGLEVSRGAFPQEPGRLFVGGRADEQEDAVEGTPLGRGGVDEFAGQGPAEPGEVPVGLADLVAEHAGHGQGRLDCLLEELLLGPEIAVDEHRRHSGVAGDFPQAYAVVARPGEGLARRIQDGLPGRGRVAPRLSRRFGGRIRPLRIFHVVSSRVGVPGGRGPKAGRPAACRVAWRPPSRARRARVARSLAPGQPVPLALPTGSVPAGRKRESRGGAGRGRAP